MNLWIGNGLADWIVIGILLVDRFCVGLVPVVRFASDWLWQIGMRLFQDWWIGGGLGLNCLIGS